MWWGHPVTSGIIDHIDYFFGLDSEIYDSGMTQYTEQLVRMKYINTIPFPLPVRVNNNNNNNNNNI
jgi:hypothetical protein